jgi:hypothetical protein
LDGDLLSETITAKTAGANSAKAMSEKLKFAVPNGHMLVRILLLYGIGDINLKTPQITAVGAIRANSRRSNQHAQ